MKKLSAAALGALIFMIAGCAGFGSAMTKFAGMGVISEETSTFDGRKIIEVSGNNVMGTFVAQMGGRWESVDPENVLITLTYASDVTAGAAYTGFTELSVNIGGEISRFAVVGPTLHDSSTYNTVSQTIYTKSISGVRVPLQYLGQMIDAPICKLQVVTSGGYSEGDFAVESNGGAPMAKVSLREFYNKVSAYKQANPSK